MADDIPATRSMPPKAPLVAAVDPNQAFRHMIETERMVAMQHEAFLKIQLDTLVAELASTRTVIASCDAALERSSIVVAVEDPSAPPPLTTSDPPIPAFLTKEQLEQQP